LIKSQKFIDGLLRISADPDRFPPFWLVHPCSSTQSRRNAA
jgi:hypothetical protein